MFPPSKVPTNLTLRQSGTRCSFTTLKISSSATLRFTSNDRSRTTEGYRGKGEYWITFTGPFRSARQVQLQHIHRLSKLVRRSDVLCEPADRTDLSSIAKFDTGGLPRTQMTHSCRREYKWTQVHPIDGSFQRAFEIEEIEFAFGLRPVLFERASSCNERECECFLRQFSGAELEKIRPISNKRTSRMP